jgi:hypothetical protein
MDERVLVSVGSRGGRVAAGEISELMRGTICHEADRLLTSVRRNSSASKGSAIRLNVRVCAKKHESKTVQ